MVPVQTQLQIHLTKEPPAKAYSSNAASGVDPSDDNSESLHHTPPRENCDIFSGDRRLDGFPVRTGSRRTLFSPQPVAGLPEEQRLGWLPLLLRCEFCVRFSTSATAEEDGGIGLFPALLWSNTMATEWYYSQGGEQHGPVSGGELEELAASAKVLPSDLVWKEGMDEWKPAAQVKGLLPETPPPLPGSPSGGSSVASMKRVVSALVGKGKAFVQSEPVQRKVKDVRAFWSKLSGKQKAYCAAGTGVVLILLIGMMSGGNGTRRPKSDEPSDQAAAMPEWERKILESEPADPIRPDETNYEKLRTGMTQQEVEAVIGTGFPPRYTGDTLMTIDYGSGWGNILIDYRKKEDHWVLETKGWFPK